MKRKISLFLAMLLLLACCACGQEGTKASADGLDVDLTAMSSTMVYAEVNNMMTSPQDYIGKNVKMEGQFVRYPAMDTNGNEIPDKAYFACVIADATSCCVQGMEFITREEYTYPADYPAEGEDIVVTGTFQTYEEDGYLYCTLVDAVLG